MCNSATVRYFFHSSSFRVISTECGAITALIIAPVFVRALENFLAISESGNTILDKALVQSIDQGRREGGQGEQIAPGPQNWKDLAWVGFEDMKWFLWSHK